MSLYTVQSSYMLYSEQIMPCIKVDEQLGYNVEFKQLIACPDVLT